ncbi:MAG: hypothetical protein ABUS47_01360 [Steroidobacter sp.]
MSQLVILAGGFVLLRALRRAVLYWWLGVVNKEKNRTEPLLLMPMRLLENFFAVLSILFSKVMISTQFGLAICLGLASYYAFDAWVHLRRPGSSRSFFSTVNLLTLASSFCYATAVAFSLLT